MKLVNFACPGCGAQLEVDVDRKQATCPYCGKVFPVDDEVQRFEMQGAAQAGYEFEKGRQKAQAELAAQQRQARQSKQVHVNVQPAQPPKKRRTWLWVLGWIVIFPVPLTLIMLNNETVKEKLKPQVRYGIIVAAWLLYFVIGVAYGGNGHSGKADPGSSSAAVTAVQSSSAAASSPAAAFIEIKML